MKKAIATYAPLFSGFYNSIWEPDFEGEEEYLEEQGFKGDASKNFDNKGYEKNAAKEFINQIENELVKLKIIRSMKFEDVVSPKYYNYSTDSINVEIVPSIKHIRRYIYANKEAFEKHLEEHHKSRSGFHSFFSHEFDDWKEYTNNFIDYTQDPVHLGSILEFIVQNEKIDEVDLYYNTETRVSEYISSDIYKLIENVENFVKYNYVKPKLLKLVKNQFEENSEDIDFEVIIQRVSKEIEDHTLTLSF
jgi:uncharacterized protein YpuA (DUF1002 family)